MDEGICRNGGGEKAEDHVGHPLHQIKNDGGSNDDAADVAVLLNVEPEGLEDIQ